MFVAGLGLVSSGSGRALSFAAGSRVGSTSAQSELALAWDVVGTQVDIFNHIPGGSNVLYMDGHVEFLRYSETSKDFPVTRAFAEITTLGHNT